MRTVLMLGEELTWRDAAGLLIVAGLLITSYGAKKEREKDAAEAGHDSDEPLLSPDPSPPPEEVVPT